MSDVVNQGIGQGRSTYRKDVDTSSISQLRLTGGSFLKQHNSQTLEDRRQGKFFCVEPDTKEATSSKIAVEDENSVLNVILESATTYLSMEDNSDPEGSELTVRGKTLYRSLLTAFLNITMCKRLLDVRGEMAQVLIDAIQRMLDDRIVALPLKNNFIFALAALVSQSNMYPRRFILHGVIGRGGKIVRVWPFTTTITVGSLGGKAVCIKTLEDKKRERNWLQKMVLWAQLSHPNVLSFSGICLSDDGYGPPGLVSPYLKDEDIVTFLERYPHANRQALISDVAAGMFYLHDNGLVHGNIEELNVLVTFTTFESPRACLAGFGSMTIAGPQNDVPNPSSWAVVYPAPELLETFPHRYLTQASDVYAFAVTSYLILVVEDDELLGWNGNLREVIPEVERSIELVGHYIHDELDDLMWKLLLDCSSQDPAIRPTACHIVERLKKEEDRRITHLLVQHKETEVLVETAAAYHASLRGKLSSNNIGTANMANKLYNLFLNMFRDLTRYKHFVNCRGEQAQVLIDAMQDLLDNNLIEPRFSNDFLFALAALAGQSRLYPQRFNLQDVIHKRPKADEEYVSIERGSWARNMVCIKRTQELSHLWEQKWSYKFVIWAQLSHKNVLKLHGICSCHDEYCNPGLVSPFLGNGNVEGFLEKNPKADRRSLISDIAAGMSYLHNNGIVHGEICAKHILITSTVPPHACLAGFDSMTITHACGDGTDTEGPDVDDYKFFRKYGAPVLYNHNMQTADDVFAFSMTSYWIFTYINFACWYNSFDNMLADSEHKRPVKPIGNAYYGLDDFMWRLLEDCWASDPSIRPNAHQIVHRLEEEKQSRTSEKREKVESMLNTIFTNTLFYKRLLSTDGIDAQILIDGFQLLLDTNSFLNRGQLVAGLRRLSAQTEQYPSRFSLVGPVSTVEDMPFASGSCADIFKVSLQGVETCFKVIRVSQRSLIEHMTKVYAREVILWGQLSHPNILPFYGLSKFRSQLAFVTSWATNGNLNEYLTRSPGVNRLLLCSDTAAGVEYLHNNDIVHGDLKGANILINSCGRAVLGDFGLASVDDPEILKWTAQSTVASQGGTTRWQAPELHETEDKVDKIYNTKESDIFAWANVCYEIFTGRLPFYEVTRESTVLIKVLRGDIPTHPQQDDPAWLEHGLNERIWDLMENCWKFQPSERPKIATIITRINAEKPYDARPPVEWGGTDAMHFRNAQDRDLLEDLFPVWEEQEAILSQFMHKSEDFDT